MNLEQTIYSSYKIIKEIIKILGVIKMAKNEAIRPYLNEVGRTSQEVFNMFDKIANRTNNLKWQQNLLKFRENIQELMDAAQKGLNLVQDSEEKEDVIYELDAIVTKIGTFIDNEIFGDHFFSLRDDFDKSRLHLVEFLLQQLG